MGTAIGILNTIETRAESAIVQELPFLKKEVLQLRPSLSPEDQDHADAYHALMRGAIIEPRVFR